MRIDWVAHGAIASAELRAHEIIERKGSDGEFPLEVARKIVDDNPRRFYGL